MGLNKKSVDDFNAKGRRVLVRCDFNVPLKDGVITDDTRIKAALPTINKLISEGAKVILCSHLGKVKEGPNEKESLAPVAKALSEKLGKEVVFVADYNVTGEAATAAVAKMNDGDVVLLQNTRFRGKEETKVKEAGEAFAKELADLADDYVCDAFGSAHRAHASVSVVTKYIKEKGGNIITMGDSLHQLIEKAQQDLPAGMEIQRVSDQPAVVESSIAEFISTLREAIIFRSGTVCLVW